MSGIGAVLGRIQEIETAIKAIVPATTATTAAASSSTAAASTASAPTSFASVLEGLSTQDVGASSVAGQASASPAPADPTTRATSAAGTAGAATTGAVTGDALVAQARTFLGVPYAWGGESMSGIDCSGLVQRSLGALGIEMPRVARDQMTRGDAVASLAEARVGDLLVFDGGSHIAIYLGDGRMIDAPKPGDVVRERDVYETPTAIRRVLPDVTAASSTVPAASSSTSTDGRLDQLLATSAAQRSSLSLMLGAAA